MSYGALSLSSSDLKKELNTKLNENKKEYSVEEMQQIIIDALSILGKEYTDVLKEHFECLYEDKKLETKINSCIIDAETVADDASSTLLDIRRKIKNANNKVKDILQKMISSSTYQKALQENIITMRSDRFVIPVKAEYKGTIQGIVHDVSSTGATVFIEPISVVETNNEIRKLLAEEKEENSYGIDRGNCLGVKTY